MSATYLIPEWVAWVEAADGGQDQPVVWVSHLDRAEQFELTDIAWLIWMLLGDGLCEPGRLHAELLRVQAELDDESTEPPISVQTVQVFLDALERQGLLVRA